MIARISRTGEIAASAVILVFFLYLLGHVVAALLRGSFLVVAR